MQAVGTGGLESTVKQIAIASIDSYKKYLSPHKGFACSHRVLHGGESCSDFVKQVFLEQRLETALQSSVKRFQACAMANRNLRNTQAVGGCVVLPCCFPCIP